MANYTQQCRTCHVNIEGTGEDICYRCLQRERDCARDRYSAMERAEATAHEQIYQLQKERDALVAQVERLTTKAAELQCERNLYYSKWIRRLPSDD